MSASDIRILAEKFLAGINYSHIDWHGIHALASCEASKGRVTVHPYGFFIIKLDVTPGCQLRIHVWLDDPRPTQDPDWPPHDHNFAIDSLVLYGSLINQTWKVVPNGAGQHVLYRVNYKGQYSALNRTNENVDCSLESEACLSAGMTYSVPLETFHAGVVKVGDTAMTLCLMHSQADVVPHVVGCISGQDRYLFKRDNCSPYALTKLLAHLDEFFGNPRSTRPNKAMHPNPDPL